MREVVFVDGARSAFTNMGGGLRDFASTEIAGFVLRGLAEKTGIPIRTIQQYEQRQKDINRASGQYLLQFASALNCRMEDLMEEEAAPPN